MSTEGRVRRSVGESIRLGRDRIRRAPRRVLLTWVIQALVLLALGWLLPGVLVENPLAALIATAVIGGLNALVRPIIVMLTLPLTVATFGFLSLVINSAMIVLAAPLVPGLEVSGFLPALALAVIFTVATTVVNVVLAIDEDETFYEELARRLETGDREPDLPRPNGLVIVQIDGLAAPILRNAIRVGTVPRMAGWVRSGSYELTEWECPPPSQTSASQAGILHGNNDDIPAFRWYEKDSGRLLVSNHPADATEIERRVSDGDGLLAPGGSSVGNLFSGDARRSAFVMSRMGNAVGELDVDAFSLYFLDPAAFIRTIVLGIGEFAKELLEARRQRRQDIQPRIHRGTTFAFLRAATNVVLRDLNTTFVVRSMSLGAPVIYVDYTDYDEIAHHAGPERIESLRALTGVDRVIASLERAARGAPRHYRFVVLSDHGQSQGATFLQRYGQSLETLVRDLMGGEPAVVAATTPEGEAVGINALLAELAQRRGVAGRAGSAMLRSQGIDGGAVDEKAATSAVTPETDVVVCASGNLANIYFTANHERMGALDIEARYPGLLQGLAGHPGIGFVMVDSADGPVVLGARGVHYLRDDRVEGEDPLARFGERSADHLRRLDSFRHVGDLLVNSTYDPGLGEVAAFEELVGSHGGMGGPQTQPFLLHPAELEAEAPLVGAPAVHRQLRAWARDLAVEAPLSTRPAPEGAAPRPRAIGWVAAWQALVGAFQLLIGAIALLAVVLEVHEQLPIELIEQTALVGIVLGGLGLVGVASGYGLWRRQRWAWILTLAISGFNVLQLLLALASGGFTGLVRFGLLGALTALAIFYYLTRPHVAAAFGRRPRSRSAVEPRQQLQ